MPVVVLTLALLAQLGQLDGALGPIKTAPARKVTTAGASNVVFRALHTSGTYAGMGFPTMGDVCTTHASLMTGDYFCLRGDGTSTSSGGNWAPVAVGSPNPTAARHCSNGVDCLTSSHWTSTTAGADYYRTTGNVSIADDFTYCWGGEMDAFSGSSLGGLYGAVGTATRAWRLNVGTSNMTFVAYNAASASTTLTFTPVARVLSTICLVYDRVGGAGDNVMRAYVDGALATSSAVAVLLHSAASSWYGIARTGESAGPASRSHFAFHTSRVLTADEIASVTATARGTLTGTGGEAITTTRASVASCISTDGAAMSWVANNRPCVAGGLHSFPSMTNSLLRSEEFDNATWVKASDDAAALPTVTANAATAPDGTTTADALVFPATATGTYQDVRQNVAMPNNVPRQFTVWLKAPSGTPTVYVYLVDAASTFQGRATCSLTTSWSRCGINVSSTGANGGLQWAIGWNTNDGANQSKRDNQTIHAWGAQLYSSSFGAPALTAMWPTVRTEGSAVARSADRNEVAKPTLFSALEGSASIGVMPSWTGQAPATGYHLANGSNAILFYSNTTSSSITAYDGTTSRMADANYTSGVNKRYRTTYSDAANEIRIYNLTDSTGGTASVFATMTGGATLGIGNLPGANAGFGTLLSGLTICKTASATECAE